MIELYEGPWPFSEVDKRYPASVRLRNIGAIGASKDGHEYRFGALEPHDLPASDGSTLPTPAFKHVYGGAAYYGHYVMRRASISPGVTSIAAIFTAYSTGHSYGYLTTVSEDTGIGVHDKIDLWKDEHGFLKLYRIMLAMGRWEAAARKPRSPGYGAFEAVYNTANQRVVDELFYGLQHGCREAWRDAGYQLAILDTEMTYAETQEQEPQEEQEVGQDPLIHGMSGYRTIITGTLGVISTFLASVFELLGFENAQKLGDVTAQVFIGLALLFLALKFWKRLEKLLKGVTNVSLPKH